MKLKSITILAVMLATILGSACGKVKAKAEESPENSSVQAEQPKPLPEGAIAFDYASHLYFDVVLRDSIPARMIFDTGNTNILIDTKFYKKYFAPSDTLQKIIIQGAGNSLEAAYKDIAEWKYSVGEYSLTEQGAVVMDLQKILGSGVDGMFGMEFMRGRKVEFNYADGYMRILSQDDAPAEDYVCIKCKWLDQRKSRILLPLSVKIDENLSFEGNFLVDMGSSGGLDINSSLAAKLKLTPANVKKKVYDTGGVGGSRTDYIFKAKNISVAGKEITNVRTSFSGNTQGSMSDDRYDGLIGNGLLERFDVIFDFTKGEIWLRENKNANVTTSYDSGMTLTPYDDCWVVNGLIEGGNAHKAGVKRGDIIVSINGLARENIDLKRLKKMNAAAEEWKVVVKRDNTTQEITFEKEKL